MQKQAMRQMIVMCQQGLVLMMDNQKLSLAQNVKTRHPLASSDAIVDHVCMN